MVEIGGTINLSLQTAEVFINNMPSVKSNNSKLLTDAKVQTADLEATNA